MAIYSVKESAAKDIQIARLEMQLEMAEERAKLRAEFFETNNSNDGRRHSSNKFQRFAQIKMHPKDALFSSLISVSWSNEEDNDTGVNSFVRLKINNNIDDDGLVVWEPISVMPQLTVRCSSFPSTCPFFPAPDYKHRVFGFCFRGPAVSLYSLRTSGFIKEAYGVQSDGVHYVIVVLFYRNSLMLSAASTMPYALGLMPCTVMAEVIPGTDYHLTAYMANFGTDDAVLEMLKRPSEAKWFYHSS